MAQTGISNPGYRATPMTHPSEYPSQDQSALIDSGIPPRPNPFNDEYDSGLSKNTAEQIASAPPVEHMDKVNGYENVTFYVAPLAPPANDENLRGQPPQRSSFSNYPALTEDQAREALVHFVTEHCCYGKKPAQEMLFRSIENSSAFHYTLETFGEKRETRWMYEPYIGQPIDSVLNGPAPSPWDIGVASPPPYKETKMLTEVPHTASVKPCHDCCACGRRRCPSCLGDGQVVCSSCSGRGTGTNGDTCTFCQGQKKQRCMSCHGHGQVCCKTCNGKGQLKCYIQLAVMWKNHVDDYIVERTSLPEDLIRTVSGQVAFEEDLPRVWPINHFPDQTVNTASAQLVQQHGSNFGMERIARQRHRIRIVPVAQVYYTWREESDYFFVYGFENKVYAPNYPQKCCCGCSIL